MNHGKNIIKNNAFSQLANMKDKWWAGQDPQKIEIARISNNRRKSQLLQKKLYVFDQDGTIYLNFKPLQGARDFINYLNKRNRQIVFISNNSSIGTSTYRRKLTKLLGIKITQDQIYNSTLATVQYLQSNGITKIYCLGTPDFVDELFSYGLKTTEKDPQIVVLAFDTTLTYEKLKKTCLFIRSGLDYIATHPDKVCPTQEGLIPDTGSFISLIETATGVKSKKILGKPNPDLIYFLLDKLHVSSEDTIIFGDRLYTDIQMGKNSDITTALVLTGESKMEDIDRYGVVPDFVFKDLKEVFELLKEMEK